MFCTAEEEVKEKVRRAATEQVLTAEQLQAIADLEAAKAEERRRREEERIAAAKMIELMRQNTLGRASGQVVGQDLDITYSGQRSVGTYKNPLRGKYGGLPFSQLPDFYLRWMQRERSVPNWAKGIAKREETRRREKVGSAG